MIVKNFSFRTFCVREYAACEHVLYHVATQLTAPFHRSLLATELAHNEPGSAELHKALSALLIEQEILAAAPTKRRESHTGLQTYCKEAELGQGNRQLLEIDPGLRPRSLECELCAGFVQLAECAGLSHLLHEQ